MLHHLRKYLIALPRSGKRAIMFSFDTLAIAFAIWAATAIRKGTINIPLEPLLPILGVLIIPSIAIFARMGLYRAVIRFLGVETLYAVFKGVSVSALIFATALLLLNIPGVPRSSVLIYWLLAGLLIAGSRFFMRDVILNHQDNNSQTRKPILIYGAGSAGHQLSVLLNRNNEVRVIGFLDDDQGLQGSRVNNLPVHAPNALAELISTHAVAQVLLALPRISRARRKAIIDSLEPYPVHVYTMPGIEEILTGKASMDDIREVEIDDLLGRDPVAPNQALLRACITDKVVMVTGAGGSIGSELCRQIHALQPSHLLLLDSSEYALYQIERELKALTCLQGKPPKLIALLGNVQDQMLMRQYMQHFRVQTLYHAAAYKHVPMVEHNIAQGIRNNILGTLALARASIETGVETFVLISTDKAVRPTNVMGATKRFAELILQALAQQQDQTRFCMVRFGNVLGSSGSVVPVFREQIKNGGPVTVTHPDIIRYFMTIPEAALLVIQAGSMGTGGDVFVLDMGKPVKIFDLAKKMIRLMGKTVRSDDNPHGEIAIEYTGLRPGEKLYEELLIGDNVTGTEHAMIMRAEEHAYTWAEIESALQQLNQALQVNNIPELREILIRTIQGYTPSSPIVDHNARKEKSNLLSNPAIH